MKNLLILLTFLAGTNVWAQNSNVIHVSTDSLRNRLHLTVVDVVDRTEITGFKVSVFVGNDTMEREVFAAKDFSPNLYQGMQYRLMITKNGFDTLNTEWIQPADTADVYVDFYMRKPGITKKEKKEAIRQSRQPIVRVTGNEGGFQMIGGTGKYACESTVYIYEAGGNSAVTHNYRKFRPYRPILND